MKWFTILTILLFNFGNTFTLVSKKVGAQLKFRVSADQVFFCVSHTDLNIMAYLASGAAAGGVRALSRGLTFPLDTIKTFQQGTERIAKQSDFFKGIIPAVISAVPANALFFLVYKTLEAESPCILQLGTSSDDSLICQLFISTLATFPQNAVKIPAEYVKQRCQLEDGTTPLSSWDVVKDAFTKGGGGLRTLYTGGNAMLLREIPFNAIQMATYSFLQAHSSDLDAALGLKMSSSGATAAVLGLLAGAWAALLTQPFDVIKTKLITRSGRGAEVSRDGQNELLECLHTTLQESGVSGLFVGLTPRLLLVSIGGLFYFWAQQVVEGALTTAHA